MGAKSIFFVRTHLGAKIFDIWMLTENLETNCDLMDFPQNMG